MPKIQIYVPDELHAMLKKHGGTINASALFQAALQEELAERTRQEAAASAVEDYEREFGAITDEQIMAANESIAKKSTEVGPKRRKSRAA